MVMCDCVSGEMVMCGWRDGDVWVERYGDRLSSTARVNQPLPIIKCCFHNRCPELLPLFRVSNTLEE